MGSYSLFILGYADILFNDAKIALKSIFTLKKIFLNKILACIHYQTIAENPESELYNKNFADDECLPPFHQKKHEIRTFGSDRAMRPFKILVSSMIFKIYHILFRTILISFFLRHKFL